MIDKLYKEKQHGWFGVVSLLRNIVVLPFLTQWMSEIVDSTKPYMLYVFFYTYKFMTKFNSKLGTVRDQCRLIIK